ncbi:MAG: glycosyltransferase family 2 protein [Phycisphaerae bacterium]|nr:glycosyltransferase family 2 protein [Phycisphaerae bacterium]
MSATENRDVTFSFICPVYNEQDGLEAFHRRLTAAAVKLGEPYEVIYVNDGSTDESAAVVRRVGADDPNVKYVEFSRNFGHQIAVTAGYDYARGRAVISLDSNGLQPPEMITDLVARWREGFEVVYAVRNDAKGGLLRRLAYRGMRCKDLTAMSDFRLMDRKAVDALRRTREQARFVRGLVHWIGFRQIAVPYTAPQSEAGKKTCPLKRFVRLAGAGVVNFSPRPLRLASALGGLLVLAAMVYALVALVLWPLGNTPSPLMHLAAGIVGLFGMQFLLLGLLGEYVARIFDEAKNRPLYIVRQTTGFEPSSSDDDPLPHDTATPEKREKRFVLYT